MALVTTVFGLLLRIGVRDFVQADPGEHDADAGPREAEERHSDDLTAQVEELANRLEEDARNLAELQPRVRFADDRRHLELNSTLDRAQEWLKLLLDAGSFMRERRG